MIYLIGVGPDDAEALSLGLAGSAYQQLITGSLAGRPPLPDLPMEAKVGCLVREAIARGLLGSAHDCSDGGLCVALAESSIASGLGIEIDLSVQGVRLDRVLFAEGGSRIVVSVKADRMGPWEALLAEQDDLPITRIGVVTEQPCLQVRVDRDPCLNLEVEQCRHAYSSSLPRRLDGNGERAE